jgi:trigger factor
MEVKENRKENCIVNLNFEVPFSEVKDEFNKNLQKIKRDIKMPGFRKGKVPESIIRKRALPMIIDDFKENYAQKIFEDYVKEKEFKLYSKPNVNKVEFDENEPFILDIEFEIFPELELNKEDYSDIKIDKPEYKVTEKDIEQEIKNRSKKDVSYEPIGKRKIKVDDIVSVNLDTKDENGNEVKQLTFKDYSITVKKSDKKKKDDKTGAMLLDKINDALIDKKIDDEFTIEYKYEDDIESPDLRGKTVNVNVKINKAETEKYPEINDELAKKLNFDSVDDMKGKIEKELAESKKNEAENKAFDEIIDKIIEKKPIDLPDSMIDNVNKYQQQMLEQRFTSQGLTKEILYKFSNTTPENWLEKNKDNAVRTIKEELIVEQLKKLENIDVDKEEIDEKLEETAKLYKTDKKQMKRDLIKNNQWDNFKESLIFPKLKDKLIEICTK